MPALVEAKPSTLLVSWRKLRQLLPVYAAIAASFRFPPPPCNDISELPIENGDGLLRIATWIDEIDSVSHAQHLRTVLQELDVCSSDMCVNTWLQHFISKPARTSADRDKVDFLLAHYLRMNLPPSLQEGRPNYSAMKAVLEPVLGSCEGELPEETQEVEELIGIAERCRTLAEFEQSGIIRRGRELKLRAGERYFTSPFLLCFTHFNAVVRRECTRLMNSDLKFIGDALVRLEQQGVTHIDCTAANWSDHEPIGELKNKWSTWELLENDYSRDFFANLIAFRSAVEEALARSVELSMTSVSQELRSIHKLLLDVRSQIDELPRKLATVGGTHANVVAAPASTKPALVRQAPLKAAPAAPGASPAKPSALPISTPPNAQKLASTTPPPPTEGVTGVIDPGTPRPNIPTVTGPPASAVIPIRVAKPEPVSAPEMPVPVVAPAPVPSEAATVPPDTKPAAGADAQIRPGSKPIEPVDPAPGTDSPAADQPTQAVPATAASAAEAVSGPVDLEAGIARLQKTLSGKRPSAISIAVAGTRILLTSAETSMFAVSNDRFAHRVQRAVMMRICLVSALETHSKTREKSEVAALVPVARTEHAAIRALIAESKANKLAREEEILSATAKQLSAMLERAERAAR